MFKKKPTSPPGRIRPNVTVQHQNASVFSYRARRSAATTPGAGRAANPQPLGAAEGRRRQDRNRLGRSVRLLLIAGGVGLLLLNLLLSPNPRLVTSPGGGKEKDRGELFLHSEEQYRAAAANIVTSSPFYRTKLTINAKKVANELSKQFPELGSVIVSVPLIGQRPVFYLEPATPAILLATPDNEVYILDTSGKVLATLARVPKIAKLNLPTVIDESGLSVHPGDIALPSTHVAFITEVVGQLKAKQLTVNSLTLPTGTSELHLRPGGAPYMVKFNLHSDARAAAGAYLAVKQRLDKTHTVPSGYIDVRVEGRAYYR